MTGRRSTTGFDHERRRFLVTAGLVGTAIALPARADSAARNVLSQSASDFAARDSMAVPMELDIRNPEHNLVTYMKILSDLSDRPTYGFHTGRILSVAPRRVGEPLLDFVACKQDRVRRLTDGSYQHGYRGVILFTELDTGRVLDTFENPLTGKTNRVQHFKTSWDSGIFTAYGAYSLGAGASEIQNAPGLQDKPFQLGWNIVRNDVWITCDERVEVRDSSSNVRNIPIARCTAIMPASVSCRTHCNRVPIPS